MNYEHTPEQRKLWHDGPNYTADAVIIDKESNKILLIQRNDTGQWALPGGFIDGDELALEAARREVAEETGAAIYSEGTLVYEGPVEDPRNSDTAWIETSAYLFFAPSTTAIAGQDDARDATWQSLDELPELYGSHGAIIESARPYL